MALGGLSNIVTCILPGYLGPESLSRVLRLTSDRKTGRIDSLRIHEQHWALPLPDDVGLTVHFDWSHVMYFDDVALLHLVLVQQSILRLGVGITHYAKNNENLQRRRHQDNIFSARAFVLRQLGAMGYFRYWLSEGFGASTEEVHRLSTVNPLRDLPPLPHQGDNLPITACQSVQALATGSPEDVVLRRYEEDAAIHVFTHQDTPEMQQRRLIADGEFGQLIIRQCRKNTIEHASPFTGALSIARVIRRSDIARDWGLSFSDWKGHMPGPLERKLSHLPKDHPVLDMTAIDDGCGIPSTIEATWIRHALKKTQEWQRVDRITGSNWPRDAKLIEFVLDKKVSRKKPEWRSTEDSGLGRIAELVSRDQGLLEIISGHYQVTHESGTSPVYSTVDRPLDWGTVVRIVLPLTETPAFDQAPRVSRASAAALVGGTFTDSDSTPQSWNLICLRDLWDTCTHVRTPVYPYYDEETASPHEQTSPKPDIDQKPVSPESDTIALISSIRKTIEDAPPGSKITVLDWAELPWGEHEASRFLDRVRLSILNEGHFNLPIVHINVPKKLLLLSEKAVFSYTQSPQLPMCVFLEGGNEWYWLGLPTPEHGWGSSWYESADPDARNAMATRYLLRVFDDILTGRQRGAIPHGPKQGSRQLALRYLAQTDLFEEIPIKHYSDSQLVPSGQFRPKLSYEAICGVIAGTFISLLRAGLKSDFCSFPPQQQTPRKKKKKRKVTPLLIKLPNGLMVDRFYRCDGLLGYAPPSRNSALATNTDVARERFKDTLVAHLVDLAKALESHTPSRFDLVVSCTSPTHWFVHQLADGLSDASHQCGHFVGTTAASFAREFKTSQIRRAAKVLVFTDVVSTGGLVTRMIKILLDAGLQVRGLIGFLDTRTPEEVSKTRNRNDLTSFVDRDNIAILTRIEVKKRRGGKLGWRIDPQTLEPIPMTGQGDWTDGLSGIGPVALDGKDIANWLVAFEAIRYRHFTHGGHHSEFVCDVKCLLSRPEVRTLVAGRLNLYIRENDIEMIVYPNHSNAYLMADMIHELYGSENQPPVMSVALCRDSRGERSYVLPRVGVTNPPQTVMLLDDGFVTGDTIRSLAAAVVEKYTRVKEIHVVVFVNEMTPAVVRYWTTLATSRAFVPRTSRGSKRAFLAPKFNFSSFMSLPNRSYAEDDCPLCKQYREFTSYSEDDSRTVHEREFYRLWARELTPMDLYHDPGLSYTGMAPAITHDPTARIKNSRDALYIARFAMLLSITTKPLELLAETAQYSLPVRINCLRRFLRMYATTRDSLRDKAWGQLLEVIRSGDTDVHNRTLAIRACIAEQVTPPTFTQFRDLLTSTAPHLADPQVLGGLMAFIRMAFVPGQLIAPWQQEDVCEVVSQIQKQTHDPDVQSHQQTLLEGITGVTTAGVGSSVVYLRKAFLSLPGHQSARDDVDTLSKYLGDLDKASSVDAMLLKVVPRVTMRVLDRFAKLERAARVLMPHARSQTTEEWQQLLNETQSKLDVLSQLMGQTLSTNLAGTRKVAYEAGAAVAYLKSAWLAPETGCARRLLEPFFQAVRPVIEEAISFGERDYGKNSPEHRIVHDYEDFIAGTGAKIEVLCHPSVLVDAIRNIVSNIWKHVVPHSVKMKQETLITWTCEITPQTATIQVVDNGPGVTEDDSNREGDRGYARITPHIKEYDGFYFLQTNSSGGAKVILRLHCRKVPP